MKKNSIARIVATLALFGIIIGIVGTGLLVIFSGNTNETKQLNQEELNKLINNMEKGNSGATASGIINNVESLTGVLNQEKK